ncbi:putative peptidoglycan-binding domain-containing protein [Microvirga lotononidis]|uniref:Putative peptidoglycan-binding domain-containing protein n=3 Tax=Microvirga lotononidis TaxID=864069 RepID=I4Z4G9_9HYPH|nr:putative peptidoglycan-binding domain-containing protein [Microvirga lotononidis]
MSFTLANMSESLRDAELMKSVRLLLILTLVSFGGQARAQTTADDLSALDPDNRSWVEQTCPRSHGPSLWMSCVNRQIVALRAPGWPAVSALAPEMQKWVMQTCPVSHGPQLWRSCAERQVAALSSSLPNISDLSAEARQWIDQTCPRSHGPQLWKSCVERESAAVRRATGQSSGPQNREGRPPQASPLDNPAIATSRPPAPVQGTPAVGDGAKMQPSSPLPSNSPLMLTVRPTSSAETLRDLARLEVAVEVQLRLKERGFLKTSVIDGVWGPRSRIALRDFKVANGLPRTDEWDLPSQMALFDSMSAAAAQWYVSPDPATETEGLYRPFAPAIGMALHPLNPSDANLIQARLSELGYYRYQPEGIWGLVSRSALQDFKAANGLSDDDVWDSSVEASLRQARPTPASDTPFGEWSVVGTSCSAEMNPQKMVVSAKGVVVGSMICELQERFVRSNTDWSGHALCHLNGRDLASKISLRVTGQRLIDRSIVGTSTIVPTSFDRCS